MSEVLELIRDGEGDDLRLLSPEAGVFTCALPPGCALAPGQVAGSLLSLGRPRDLVVPAGVHGIISSPLPDRVHEPVGFREQLYALRSLEAGVHQLVANELAFDVSQLVGERFAAAGFAASTQIALGLVQEQALAEGIFAAVANVLDDVEALADFVLRIPVGAIELAVDRDAFGLGDEPLAGSPFGAWKRHLAWIDLVDDTGAVAGHVTGAGVHDGRIQLLGEIDQVVDAKRVGAQGLR